MHCPHCGGVVGRDCFNVEECGAITQEIERREMIDAELEPLRAQLAAERAAHAAEVGGLRSVMTKARRLIAETFPPYSFPTPPEHEEEARAAHGVLVQIEDALAAPPTAAVEAVEGMRVALEPFKRFADRLDSPPNWVPDGCPINTDSGGVSDFSVAQVRQARAALARWKEATRG